MSTVPAAASAMPVPEPVPEVVIRILGWSAPYATCQELISGSSSVLPVSLTVVFPEDEAAEDDDGEPELVHAATIAASGMSTAAASGRRIRLVTGDGSFDLIGVAGRGIGVACRRVGVAEESEWPAGNRSGRPGLCASGCRSAEAARDIV